MSRAVHFVPRFREVCARLPDAVAVEGPAGEVSTYAALDARARTVAMLLHAQGVGPEDVVALALPRSADYVAALLGVWYVGAAFLPLDLEQPLARRCAVLTDAKVRGILGAGLRDLPAELGPWWDLASLPTDDTAPAPAVPLHDRGLAYVIYTSGSTGAPKGVEVTHAGLMPFLDAQREAFRLAHESRALFLLSPAFDASISDLGTALLAGATIVIDGPSVAPGVGGGLLGRIGARRVSHADLPPALLARLSPADAPACLRVVVTGGEVCPPEAARAWAARVRLVNVYGPTEATVCTSLVVCDTGWTRPLIGAPLPGVRYRVVDDELLIGGPCLARGYRGRPELTAARFVMRDGERLFRTGDRVRAAPDGSLEFVGRSDRQLKLEGRLVAPEEVEATLMGHPDVARAAVTARRGRRGRLRLVAHVVARGARLDEAELRRFVAEKLPAWMAPGEVVHHASLPLTSAGKVDLPALESFGAPARGMPATVEAVESAHDVAQLAGVVLERAVGADDDLFRAGADSIAALELALELEARGHAVAPGLLYAHPTPRMLWEALRGAGTGADALHTDVLRADVARIASDLPAPRGGSPRADPEGPLFITGATGALGAAVLCNLLRHTARPLRCLVRSPDVAAGQNRLAEAARRHGPLPEGFAARVRAVPGDLTRTRLGLSPEAWRVLAGEVAGVLHCAAEVSLAPAYGGLRAPNVAGTAEVLALATAVTRKPLSHVSTLSVFVGSDRGVEEPLEEDDLSSPARLWGGYAQSKWAAEVLVREVARAHALPVRVFRPSLVVGSIDSGWLPPHDMLTYFLRALAQVRALPAALDATVPETSILPLDEAADAIARLAVLPSRDTPDGTASTFHLCAPTTTRLSEWLRALEAEGIAIPRVSQSAWEERLEQHRTLPGVAALRALDRMGNEALRPFDVFQATGARFSRRRTLAALEGEARRTAPGEDALRRYVRHALRGTAP